MTGPTPITDDEIRAEARRRLEAERLEAERRAAEEAERAAKERNAIRDAARARAIQQHLAENFGAAIAILHDPDAFLTLFTHARLVRTSQEVRVNPNGTTTEITTSTVPKLLGVQCSGNNMELGFSGTLGQTLGEWTAAAEVLRSGFRARTIQITEHDPGIFNIGITT